MKLATNGELDLQRLQRTYSIFQLNESTKYALFLIIRRAFYLQKFLIKKIPSDKLISDNQ